MTTLQNLRSKIGLTSDTKDIMFGNDYEYSELNEIFYMAVLKLCKMFKVSIKIIGVSNRGTSLGIRATFGKEDSSHKIYIAQFGLDHFGQDHFGLIRNQDESRARRSEKLHESETRRSANLPDVELRISDMLCELETKYIKLNERNRRIRKKKKHIRRNIKLINQSNEYKMEKMIILRSEQFQMYEKLKSKQTQTEKDMLKLQNRIIHLRIRLITTNSIINFSNII